MDIQAYIQSGVIESYVLGLASEVESAELETLRGQHPEIGQAIADFERLLERESLAAAVPPPAGLKNKVMQAVSQDWDGTTGSNGKTISMTDAINPAHLHRIDKRLRTWRYLAAASVILFVANAVMSLVLFNNFRQLNREYNNILVENRNLKEQRDSEQATLTSLIAMVQDTTMKVVRMKGVKGREESYATVFWDTKTKDVFVIPSALPRPAAGKQYQLWAIVDGKPVDAGMIGNCEGFCRMKNIPSAQAFAVTLEKAGGSPTPDLNAMYVLGGT